MKEKLGLDTILILVAIIVVAIFLIIALVNKGEYVDDGSYTATIDLPKTVQQANDAELLSFNAKIEGFRGKQLGKFLVSIFKYVEESNQNNPDKQIKITGVDSADKINSDATYNVTLSTDQNGYYNSVNIEEKK